MPQEGILVGRDFVWRVPMAEGLLGQRGDAAAKMCFILSTTLFLPIHDAREFGRELIPLVRTEVARRHTAAASKETL
jgi:hypothetical protein